MPSGGRRGRGHVVMAVRPITPTTPTFSSCPAAASLAGALGQLHQPARGRVLNAHQAAPLQVAHVERGRQHAAAQAQAGQLLLKRLLVPACDVCDM